MKIKLNNKIFEGKYKKDGSLVIPFNNPLTNGANKIFFQNWYNECKNNSNKSEYVKNVEYSNVLEYGVLENCFPILDMNMEYVTLVYDSYKSCYDEENFYIF